MNIEELSSFIKDPSWFGYLIVRPFGLILLGIYNFIQNYGLTVICFALLVKLVLIPLAIKSKKSMVAMSAMNAEMQGLQKRYANNREKLNEEMQKLYEKHGVNPASGCLPNFIQLPIMMGLYYAVQQPLQYILGLGRDTILNMAQLVGIEKATYTVQITIAEQLNQFWNNGAWDPKVLACGADVATNLQPLDFNFFGLNLANTPSAFGLSILLIIPILSGVTALLSSVIMQKMQGNAAMQNGSMKAMMLMMPLVSAYFAYILPGALGVYWIFNNVFTCLQEIVLSSIFKKKQAKKEEERLALEESIKQAKKDKQRAEQQAANAEKKG